MEEDCFPLAVLGAGGWKEHPTLAATVIKVKGKRVFYTGI